MNLILDDNSHSKSNVTRIILIIVITIICLVAILIGAYIQVFKTKPSKYTEISEEQYDILISEFENIFSNSIIASENASNNQITKIDSSKEVVYSYYMSNEQNQDKYSFNIQIPYINIDNSEVKKCNEEIKNIFEAKAQNIISSSSSEKTIYSVNYVAYINENILSLAISSKLMEGNNPQRFILMTFNYDLKKNKKVNIDTILETKGISKTYAESKVREKIRVQEKKVEELKNLGYVIFDRDHNSDIYKMNNASEFFIGKDGNIYIVYAYGNDEYTNEYDVVIF